MENRGLLFIPDISGFTRFVSETEIEHSRMIIQELLEVLINSNDSGLEISEIEGDAILFYKFGDNPGLESLYRQVERMFCAFHQQLYQYDRNKFCQCQACVTSIDLTLKIITHYGEFTGYTVKNFNKLIGKDVIVAHQLLKNDIDQHEYWLVTENLTGDSNPEGLAGWMKWDHSIKKTETGEVPFHYTHLGQLKDTIKPDPPLKFELSNKTKVLSLSKVYNADIITVFHASGDFRYRSRWQAGVRAIEEVSHLLPRIGMKHRRVQDDGESVIFASSYSFSPERIEFSETDENKKNSTYYTLEKISENSTRLTIDHFIRKSFAGAALFNLFKKKEAAGLLRQSMENLESIVEEIKTIR
jgi:hypothetical protein